MNAHDLSDGTPASFPADAFNAVLGSHRGRNGDDELCAVRCPSAPFSWTVRVTERLEVYMPPAGTGYDEPDHAELGTLLFSWPLQQSIRALADGEPIELCFPGMFERTPGGIVRSRTGFGADAFEQMLDFVVLVVTRRRAARRHAANAR